MKINLNHCLKICSKTVIVFSVLLVSTNYAGNGNIIVQHIQDKFKYIKTIETDFIQEFLNASGESTIRLKGKYLQASDGKFKISTGNGEIISDGTTVWNYNKKMKRVVMSPTDDRTNSFSLEKIIFEFPDLCDIKLEDSSDTGYTLDFIPKENLGFNKATLKVTSGFLVESVSIEDYNDNTISFRLDNYKLDQNIDPETFNFTPDEGIEIIDLR